MIKHFIALFLFSTALMHHAHAGVENIEHIVWDKSPIKFTLPVGKERRIDFPVTVKIEAPLNVIEASKPIQIREDGSVYWTALKAFETFRVRVITLSGYSYLMDVSAKKKAPSHPIVVLDDRLPVDEEARSKDIRLRKQYNYDYVDLIQMAAQNIYAPMRLTKRLPGVTRQPVPEGEVRLYRGGDLATKPVAQWKSPTVPSFYVTAIHVTSNALQAIVFDPRLIRGDWLAATAQHATVHPAGEDGDTTTWYLVSAQPFAEAVL